MRMLTWTGSNLIRVPLWRSSFKEGAARTEPWGRKVRPITDVTSLGKGKMTILRREQCRV
jgi:hypothetical protein